MTRPHLKKGQGDASEKALEMQASNFLKKREYQDFLVEGVWEKRIVQDSKIRM